MTPPGRGQVPQRGLHRGIATSPVPASARPTHRHWYPLGAAEMCCSVETGVPRLTCSFKIQKHSSESFLVSFQGPSIIP